MLTRPLRRLSRHLLHALPIATLLAATPSLAQYLYLTNFQYGGTQGEILRYSATTGALVDHFLTAARDGLGAVSRLALGPNDSLYVLDDAGITRFDVRTGAAFGRIVPSATIQAIAVGPDGHLYALDYGAGNRVLRFDEATGAPLGTLVAAGAGGLVSPTEMSFGTDGNLYVTSPFNTGDVRRFDGESGAFLGVFIAASAGFHPTFLHFAPNGSLYVSESGGSLRRYDAATGALLATLTLPGNFAPAGLATGPDGNLYVADELGQGVVRFSETTNAGGGLLVASGAGGLAYPRGMAFGPCSTGTGSLCLNHARFRAVAHWRTVKGDTGLAAPVQLTGETGYFWFFSRENVETVVKVLDGCGVNHRYWVFASGLTDVFVRLDVTDTKTGVTKTYSNPLGKPFKAIQDTDAFAACP